MFIIEVRKGLCMDLPLGLSLRRVGRDIVECPEVEADCSKNTEY